MTRLRYQAVGWAAEQRLIVVRQSVTRKTASGKTLSLFADDPDIHGWRYGSFVATLDLLMVEVWRLYRSRADCENRTKELKAYFVLDAFNMCDFWSTEAALGSAMLAYNPRTCSVRRSSSVFSIRSPRSTVWSWLSAAHGTRMPARTTDAVRAPPRTRQVCRPLGQCLGPARHSWAAKWLMDNLGLH